MKKLPQFKIRCSAINRITAGEIGLDHKQEERLKDLLSRKNGIHPKGLKLTETMEEELAKLQHKKLNPLPEGLKTYCKQWLKETLYKRRDQVKSKYIEKGNLSEQDGFTAMSLQLGLGMVYSNTEFKENDFLMGTCDLDLPKMDAVFDNKSSWSLDTFPMFETKCPKADYIAQIQGYMCLWKRSRGAVVYTLNDIDIDQLGQLMKPWNTDDEKQEIAVNLIYTRESWAAAKARYFPAAKDLDFVEIPEADRVKPFWFDYDPGFIAKVEERVHLCRKYIQTLIS